MPRRSPAEQLNQMIQDMLVSLSPRPVRDPSPTLAQLMPIARALRDLPRPEFKAALKSELTRRSFMNEATGHSPVPSATLFFRRPGFNNIAPYFLVQGAPKFIDFLTSAFDGIERIRVPRPDGTIMHAEVGIGDSVIELGDANDQYPSRPMTTHLYVKDADATFARALAAGATSIYAPTDDHPSGDHWGAAKDRFGNTWFIATPRTWTLESGDARSVQPYLHVREAHKLIPFLVAAFGAEDVGTHKSPEGIIHHATIKIGNATLEIDEAHEGAEANPSYLHIYVPDTDALYAQALRAGAIGLNPPSDAPYGDRAAGVKDPSGNTWFLATYKGSDRRQ